MIASLLSAKAGLAVAPLIVVAVVVAYLASEALTAYVDARVGTAPARRETVNGASRGYTRRLTARTIHPQRVTSVRRARFSLRGGGLDGRESRMAETPTDVLVAGYQDIDEATKDFDALVALVKEKQVSIEGVILVTHAEDGSVAVRQTGDNRGRKGAGWGGGVGVAVGLFAPPLLASAAVGAVAGGVVGKFVDHRVENDIHDKIGENLPPGSAGIIAIFDDEQRLGVEEALAGAQLRSVVQGDKKGTGALKESLAEAMGKFSPDRTVLPIPDPNFGGTIGRTIDASVADWTISMTPSPPEGAPNVLLVLIDDAGFGNPSTFGGPVAHRR